MAKEVTVHEALIYVMVMISAADGKMPEIELKAILAGPEGMDIALEIVKDVLPNRLHDTAYSLAVEIATADLHLDATEIRFLQMLRARIELDKLTAAAIERSAIARFRRAG